MQQLAVFRDTGKDLTTNQGTPMADDLNSLKAGPRGPTLLEDFYLREKITHFDHERIPERIVHARGTAAHGYFENYKPLSDLTCASLFQEAGKKTPVFVRFSTVAGSRGSADTPRDVRGFAVKFYTDEGVWDLVGNNIPVFFIQDAVQFPDLVHSIKPEPNNEIPQAATAHSTFWDFVSLVPESAHMLMWIMSPRTLPRSLSTMEGFGIHTFRLVNKQGKSRFVKFHWKPKKGVFSTGWDESQKIAGKDGDYQRRDLWESILNEDFPEWELGLQIVEEEDENKFDFDLLDPTKIIPEELVPVRKVGRLVLNKNVDNFFAETEQAAFCPSHIVPGIDFSNDPLLQGRLFSYLDTQISRLGVNFAELPINRPRCPVHNNERDGKMRFTVDQGRVSYNPNTLAKGCPAFGRSMHTFTSFTEAMSGKKIRERSPSFKDHFSQATLFWNSMADWEKEEIINAFSFELNMCDVPEVRKNVVNNILINIHQDLANTVAANLGLNPSDLAKPTQDKKMPAISASPALSMDKTASDIKGRKIAFLTADGVDSSVSELKTQLEKQGAVIHIISFSHGGFVKDSKGQSMPVDKFGPTAASVFYDAVLIPGGKGVETLLESTLALSFVSEAYVHKKTIAAIGDGARLLKQTRIDCAGQPGIEMGDDLKKVLNDFVDGMKKHRHHNRNTKRVVLCE